MGTRHLTRRLALQALYGLDSNPEQGVHLALKAALGESEGEGSGADVELLRRMVAGVFEKRRLIDGALEEVSRNWKISRMDRVDRSILRLAVFELMWEETVPAPVILSEAIELAKEFGAPDSPSFINGLLDKIARKHRAGEVKELAE